MKALRNLFSALLRPFLFPGAFGVFMLTLALFIFPRVVFADDIETPVDTGAWLLSLVQWIISVKGAALLVIVVGAVQIVMQFFKTSFGSLAGKWRLSIVAFLSLVGVVVAGMSSGLTFLQAALAAPTIAAVQVFVHQLVKQFTEPTPLGPVVGK